jgi:hypothetical protein
MSKIFKINELRKEYHNKTAGQIGEKARDLQTSYFTDEYVFWLENELKQLRLHSVVKALKDKEVLPFDDWTKSKQLTPNGHGNYENMHGDFVSIDDARQMYQEYIRL